MTASESETHEHEFTILIVSRTSTGERSWLGQCQCGELAAASALIEEPVVGQIVGNKTGIKED